MSGATYSVFEAGDNARRQLAVMGEVDDSTELDERLRTTTMGYGVSLVVDLSGVTWLPSHALGVLARAQRSARRAGTEIELAASAGCIAEQVLTVTALPHIVL